MYTTKATAAATLIRALGPPGTPHTTEGSATMTLTVPLVMQLKGAKAVRTTTGNNVREGGGGGGQGCGHRFIDTEGVSTAELYTWYSRPRA
jgi:hypothetical protein